MSPICTLVRGSFDDYLADALPAPQRRMLRDHLAACPECGELAVSRDPTFLFARVAPEQVPAAEAAGILSAVRTGVSLMEAERRLGRKSRRRVAGLGAAAAAAVVTLVVALQSFPAHRPPSVAARPAPVPAASENPSELSAAALADPGTTSASPDATVYDWNPGAGREEPRVVWIVDRGLDI